MAIWLDLNIDALKFPGVDNADKLEKNSRWGLFMAKSRIPTPSGDNGLASKCDDPTYYAIFLVLRDFLQPDTSTTVSEAVNAVMEAISNDPTNLPSLSAVCFELAEQIPYQHSSHLKLSRLLWLVGRSSKWTHKTKAENTLIQVHRYYQQIGEDMRDALSAPGDDGADPARYINFQAFLAHVQSAGLFLPSNDYARYAMQSAFNEDHSKDSRQIRDAWVLGAAQWVLWYGQDMFKLLMWSKETFNSKAEEKDFEAEKTRLVTLTDWKTWKMKFNDVAAGIGGHGEECRGLAKRVAGIMSALEQGMSF